MIGNQCVSFVAGDIVYALPENDQIVVSSFDGSTQHAFGQSRMLQSIYQLYPTPSKPASDFQGPAFNKPFGIAISGAGRLFVVESKASTLQVFE